MTVTMSAAKKRTSPQDWIHDYYGPILTVCASDDAEIIANKNNLTFTELLQPFSKLGTDVTIKDVDGQNHNVPCLNIILQDFKKVENTIMFISFKKLSTAGSTEVRQYQVDVGPSVR